VGRRLQLRVGLRREPVLPARAGGAPDTRVKRPPRPNKRAVQNALTTENAKGARTPRAGPHGLVRREELELVRLALVLPVLRPRSRPASHGPLQRMVVPTGCKHGPNDAYYLPGCAATRGQALAAEGEGGAARLIEVLSFLCQTLGKTEVLRLYRHPHVSTRMTRKSPHRVKQKNKNKQSTQKCPASRWRTCFSDFDGLYRDRRACRWGVRQRIRITQVVRAIIGYAASCWRHHSL
jgi:hypothetical protein